MHRAALGDLEEPLFLRFFQRALEHDLPFEPIDATLPGLAFRAVAGVDLVVADGDDDALQGPSLHARVQPQGHGGARPERRGEKLVRRRPSVRASELPRLVRSPLVAGRPALLLPPPSTG